MSLSLDPRERRGEPTRHAAVRSEEERETGIDVISPTHSTHPISVGLSHLDSQGRWALLNVVRKLAYGQSQKKAL